MTVYINGEKVYTYSSTNTYSSGTIGAYVKKINIKKGENTLMVKTLNEFGVYEFALNICEVESDPLYAGNRVDGLKFSPYSSTEPNAVKTYVSNTDFKLENYPNPAADYTNIRFHIDKAGDATINIYDLQGRFIDQLSSEYLTAGDHEYRWELENSNGSRVSSGIYICTLNTGKQSSSIRIAVQ